MTRTICIHTPNVTRRITGMLHKGFVAGFYGENRSIASNTVAWGFSHSQFELDLAEHPLERPDPPAAFVPRDREHSEVRRTPLEELAAQLLESLANHLLVSQRHRLMKGPLEALSAR